MNQCCGKVLVQAGSFERFRKMNQGILVVVVKVGWRSDEENRDDCWFPVWIPSMATNRLWHCACTVNTVYVIVMVQWWHWRLGWNPEAFLGGACMFSLCPGGFSFVSMGVLGSSEEGVWTGCPVCNSWWSSLKLNSASRDRPRKIDLCSLKSFFPITASLQPWTTVFVCYSF